MKPNPLQALALASLLAAWGCDRNARPVQAEDAAGAPAAAVVPAPASSSPADAGAVSAPEPPVRDSGMSFTDMDKNMDSGITRDELGKTELLRQHFNDADTNGDGQLSVTEVERYRSDMAGEPKPPMVDGRSFAQMDANGDGAITIDELGADEMLSRHFDEADIDQDHRLSADEVATHRAAMAAGE